MNRKLRKIALLVSLLASCGPSDEPTEARDVLTVESSPNQDALPGGLFHDFLPDGKFDAAGHPEGAEVFEGKLGCDPKTGVTAKEGVAASAEFDQPGTLCANSTSPLGDGTFILNVRGLVSEGSQKRPTQSDPADAVLEITIYSADDQVLATREVTESDFGGFDADRDHGLRFVHRGDGAARFEVTWTGSRDVRLSYVEVFRASPRLVIQPASQVLDGERRFEIEMQDPPDDLEFEIECDGLDITERLDALLASGEANRQETDFRTIVDAPADALFADCSADTRVMVRAMSGGWARQTSRVTYFSDPIPCGFGPYSDRVRVLLTGFEPFPADSTRDNSSKEAVEAYLAGPLPDGVDVMGAILPVEYDTAAELVADLVDRCDPDVVIGFGQGRSRVDVERVAYNRKDTAAVAGGVPDNRGVVYGGDPVVEAGPAERTTGLPVDTILAGLDALGIPAGPSTDPGRYVCNNLFYSIMDGAEESGRTGGFVHLPRIPSVDATSREQLRSTVETVVDAAVAGR